MDRFLNHSDPEFYEEREWPDHIAALRRVLQDRLAEAMAVATRTGGGYPNPDYSAAWMKVSEAQVALIAALADDMKKRGAIIVANLREIAS